MNDPQSFPERAFIIDFDKVFIVGCKDLNHFQAEKFQIFFVGLFWVALKQGQNEEFIIVIDFSQQGIEEIAYLDSNGGAFLITMIADFLGDAADDILMV
jgi:hypothetical protein